MKLAARIISYIYHPLLIPTLGMLVLFNSGTYLSYIPFDAKRLILLMVFLLTYLIPLLFVPFFYYQNLIMNVEMPNRKDRRLPLVISLILYMLCYIMIRRTPIPSFYHAFMLSSLISILLTLLITTRYKISIHMVGAGGLIALVAFLAFYMKVDLRFYLGASVLLAGITGSSRILLEAHKPGEVYTGFITGFSIVLLTLLISCMA